MATDGPSCEQTLPERPHHHRKQSSRSILFKALISPVKSRSHVSQNETIDRDDQRHHPPIQELDDRQPGILGERAFNMRSAPRARSCHASSMTSRERAAQNDPVHSKGLMPPSNSGSPNKWHTAQRKEKENTTPPSSIDINEHSKQSNVQTSHQEACLTPRATHNVSPRKISNSSADSVSPKKTTLSIMKRGARVMAAVAAIQGKSIPITPVQEAEKLDPLQVEARFEAMLSNRNVAPAMRDKMRNLTLRMKADLVKQEQDVLQVELDTQSSSELDYTGQDNTSLDDSTSTKRSRPRSRTFTFSRGDRQTADSPSKTQRGRSRSRPAPDDRSSRAPASPRKSSARGSRAENPVDYIKYLKNEQNPTKVEVGRLHKLRILLRNETIAWVDSFVALDGLSQILGLLDRIMAVEWREEHEDQLLHETLLCLKGLCTTESALTELSKFADNLFPALLAMLFDDEKKGPAEYSTRAVIINVLFAYLTSRPSDMPTDLEARARTVLAYLAEPKKIDDTQPLGFVMDMQTSRPYKLWCREITNVTREVFWIFLHQLNVVPLPKSRQAGREHDAADNTFATRHFPGARPPVPAAPYIGGVEWDATIYITGHLDLVNGLIASLPTREARNTLRRELQASGFEKTMGNTLRTCKEKFYAGVHDGLRAWVAAAVEDQWPVLHVCEGPSLEEQAKSVRSSPKKGATKQAPPKLEEIKLDLNLSAFTSDDNEINGWLDA